MVLSNPSASLLRPRERLLNVIVDDALLDLADFVEICGKVRAIAPFIHIFLGNPRSRAGQVSSGLWALPALTVGVGTAVGAFAPTRGELLYNKPISKLDQAAILDAKGVPAPRTARFDPKAKYDPAVWGEFVIVKPAPLSLTSDGDFVRLMRTVRLNEIGSNGRLGDLVGTRAPLLVQSYIDTGPRPACWRVLTLFGHALYCMLTVSPIERPSLSALDKELEEAVIVSKHADWRDKYDYATILSLVSNQEIIDFARKVAACFPRVPLLGIDILKHDETGELFALEVNAGGNVWHFSSRGGEKSRAAVSREARIEQFGAFDVAARALVEASEKHSR